MKIFIDYLIGQTKDVIDAFEPDRKSLSSKEKGHLDALISCHRILTSSNNRKKRILRYAAAAILLLMFHIAMHTINI